MKISILGYGVFGSAIGSHLLLKGHTIIKEEIKDSDIIFVVVPSYAVVDVLLSHKNEIHNQKIVICSKGFHKDGRLFSVVLKEEFPNNQIYFLYGPTLAEELKNHVLSVMVLASDADKEDLKKQIESDNLYIQTSDDVVGVQIGTALKNTVGIFIGVLEGAGLGNNTQAFIYSKGLQEIQKIGILLGAKAETFIGFTCAGDLFLKSRSRFIGNEIGKGRDLEEISKEIPYPKEGIESLKNILKTKDNNIDLSFFKTVYSVIFEKMPVLDAVKKIANTI